MKNILVFFGGVSQEHDISVITGVLTLNSIDKTKFNPIPVYVHKNGLWYSGDALANVSFYKDFDVKSVDNVTLISGENFLYKVKKGKIKLLYAVSGAINCMHGRNGEDGALCGLLQMCKIPLASPNAFCSAMSMDKGLTKLCLKALDIDVVPSVCLQRKRFFKDRESEIKKLMSALDYPIIVKPICGGSSIGISVARDYMELENALMEAFKYDETALCEKYLLNGVDVNCAVYKAGDCIKSSECEKPLTANDILTFGDKYSASKTGSGREFPAEIPSEVSDKIKATSEEIYASFGFTGIIRIDYLVSGNDVFLNEINSVPGSMAFYLFCNKMSKFTDLLTDLLNESFVNYLAKASTCYEFNSNVLTDGVMKIKK